MSQKRAYKQYSKEFKEEAVSLVNEQGYTVPEAAKSLGINPNMLYRWKEKLDESNGRNQVSESEREELLRLRKENRNLTLSEREEIRVLLSSKLSIRAIARVLGRSPSTISREVQRNRGRRYYKAVDANNRASRMAKRPKPCLLESNQKLKELVLEKLQLNWSPEQISGWLRKTMPSRKSMRISAETIYKTIYFRSRSALHHSLAQHLRRKHSLRHSKSHSRRGERGTINIVSGISIHERDRHIEHRRSFGHWEGDLVTGSKNSHIATLVDRKSRFTIILKIKGKDAASVNDALCKVLVRIIFSCGS